jgi:hypothetical protein
MNNADQSVILPFSGLDFFEGFAEGKGLAKASPSELRLEFVVTDTVVSVLRSGVKEIVIPRSEIDMVRLKQRWLSTQVHIRVKSLKWLADVPGCEKGEVTLQIARQDRDQAAAFVQVLSGA